jgi:hypothetical protein
VALSVVVIVAATVASLAILLWRASFPDPPPTISGSNVLAEARGWSAATLLVAIPLAAGSLWAAIRGSLRSRLVWLGSLAGALRAALWYRAGAGRRALPVRGRTCQGRRATPDRRQRRGRPGAAPGHRGAGGGAALFFSPDGSALGLPLALLEHAGFESFRLPGLILFAVNGILPLASALGVRRRRWWAPASVMAVGILLVGWIAIQVALLRSFDAPLHGGYLLLGLIIAGLGYFLLHPKGGTCPLPPGRGCSSSRSSAAPTASPSSSGHGRSPVSERSW